MPTKGNPRVIVRMERALLDAIAFEIERTNRNRKGPPYELSSWLRQAALDKLLHAARARHADAGELRTLTAFTDEGRRLTHPL
jgi:hypothetical protein